MAYFNLGRPRHPAEDSPLLDDGSDRAMEEECAEARQTRQTQAGGDASSPVLPIICRSEKETRSRRVQNRNIRIAILCVCVGIGVILAGVLSHHYLSRKSLTTATTTAVHLGYASYRGTVLPNGVRQFLGIRYAAPPVGDLRWRAPVEPEVVTEVQPADKFAPLCLATNFPYPFEGQGEDCLFLNIWAPADATDTSKLSVWVFIQGGGYSSNANGYWIGKDLVQISGNNVVLVTLNYRVGLFGFLAGEKVRENGALNVGLLDQRCVLSWVRRHISKFGGDPAHVVIHGMSAGAGSVAMHLTAYGGRNDGLFVGAITDSVFLPAQPYLSELEYQFDRTAVRMSCSDAADQMACLRGKTTAELQALGNIVQPFPGRVGSPLFYWTPCIEGEMLRDLPSSMFHNESFVNVPLLMGSTTNEGSVFARDSATKEEVEMFLRDNYPRLTDVEAAAILSRYPRMDPLPSHRSWFPTAALAYGESAFTCPSGMILDSGGLSSAAWAYRYDVRDEYAAYGLGVPHGAQGPAVFGPGNCPTPPSYYTYNAAVAPVVMRYWASFVRSLDPNTFRGDGTARWEPWVGGGGGGGGGGGQRMLFRTDEVRMEEVDGDERERCAAWESLGGATRQRV